MTPDLFSICGFKKTKNMIFQLFLVEIYNMKDPNSRVLSDLEKLILYIFISVKAINAASEAIALDNNNEKAFFRRGDARIEIKDYEEAKIDFKKVLEINKVLYNCSHIISKFSNQKQLKARNISCA